MIDRRECPYYGVKRCERNGVEKLISCQCKCSAKSERFVSQNVVCCVPTEDCSQARSVYRRIDQGFNLWSAEPWGSAKRSPGWEQSYTTLLLKTQNENSLSICKYISEQSAQLPVLSVDLFCCYLYLQNVTYLLIIFRHLISVRVSTCRAIC